MKAKAFLDPYTFVKEVPTKDFKLDNVEFIKQVENNSTDSDESFLFRVEMIHKETGAEVTGTFFSDKDVVPENEKIVSEFPYAVFEKINRKRFVSLKKRKKMSIESWGTLTCRNCGDIVDQENFNYRQCFSCTFDMILELY